MYKKDTYIQAYIWSINAINGQVRRRIKWANEYSLTNQQKSARISTWKYSDAYSEISTKNNRPPVSASDAAFPVNYVDVYVGCFTKAFPQSFITLFPHTFPPFTLTIHTLYTNFQTEVSNLRNRQNPESVFDTCFYMTQSHSNRCQFKFKTQCKRWKWESSVCGTNDRMSIKLSSPSSISPLKCYMSLYRAICSELWTNLAGLERNELKHLQFSGLEVIILKDYPMPQMHS